ncbi:MAG TPA: hypothetical protein VKG26_15860 [Bacteroidia bacterium]|nr:hypothetical protein [Bacteroidia bacterium]
MLSSVVAYLLPSFCAFFGHNGSTPGYMSCYAFDNERKNGVIMLVNFNTKNNLWASSTGILKELTKLDDK